MTWLNRLLRGADSLGTETYVYLLEAARALTIQDEVAAVQAFRSIQTLIEQRTKDDLEEGDRSGNRLREELTEVLPEPTASMRQFWRISLLLGARGAGSDPSKFVPLVRKLAQEPRVQRTAGEVVAKLGERALSRTLRAAFRLPPPMFKSGGGAPPLS